MQHSSKEYFVKPDFKNFIIFSFVNPLSKISNIEFIYKNTGFEARGALLSLKIGILYLSNTVSIIFLYESSLEIIAKSENL